MYFLIIIKIILNKLQLHSFVIEKKIIKKIENKYNV